MTGSTVIDSFLGVLTALITAFGIFAGGRKALADARKTEAPPIPPYQALEQRVIYLEGADTAKREEIDRLRRQVRRLADVLSREVAHVVRWIDDGATPPPPEREVQVLRDLIRDLDNDRN